MLMLIAQLLCLPLLVLAIFAGAKATEHLRANGWRWY